LNADIPILSATKITLVSGHKGTICGYSWRFLGVWAASDSGVVDGGNFRVFGVIIFFGNFSD